MRPGGQLPVGQLSQRDQSTHPIALGGGNLIDLKGAVEAATDALAAWESAKMRYNPQPDPRLEVGLMFTDLG